MAEAPAFGKDNRAKDVQRLSRAEQEGFCEGAIEHHGLLSLDIGRQPEFSGSACRF
jgi:hypothetical protein